MSRKNKKSVNFNSINRNIKKEGLDIGYIRIIYEDLTEDEIYRVKIFQGGEDLKKGNVLSLYPENLKPLYPNKATGVLYLGG